jgi:hypothetical protein
VSKGLVKFITPLTWLHLNMQSTQQSRDADEFTIFTLPAGFHVRSLHPVGEGNVILLADVSHGGHTISYLVGLLRPRQKYLTLFADARNQSAD